MAQYILLQQDNEHYISSATSELLKLNFFIKESLIISNVAKAMMDELYDGKIIKIPVYTKPMDIQIFGKVIELFNDNSQVNLEAVIFYLINLAKSMYDRPVTMKAIKSIIQISEV